MRANLWLRWGRKQSCSPRQELSNDMLHTICTHVNWVDSQLLVVGSQIANLTPSSSFGHNLCFKCPNGRCKPILDIYVSRAFHWYKYFFKPLNFDPCNFPLKIWESTGTPTPKVELPWGVRVHSLTPPHTPGSMLCESWLPSWPATLQTLALVVSSRLGLRHFWCPILCQLVTKQIQNFWIFLGGVHLINFSKQMKKLIKLSKPQNWKEKKRKKLQIIMISKYFNSSYSNRFFFQFLWCCSCFLILLFSH